MSIKLFISRYKILFATFFILLFLLRILLLQVPLFRNLDLEISILFSFIISIFASFSGLFLLKRKEKISHIVKSFLMLSGFLYFSFLAIEFFFFQCPLTNGILFFPIFVITTFSVGLLLAILVNPIDGYKAFLILLILILVIISYSLLEYYFEPQLFLYNPLIIFFPGLVYNELFELDLKTLIYVLSLFISSSILISYHLLEETSNQKFSQKFELHFKIIPLLILSLIFIFSETIGLNTSQLKLHHYFQEVKRGENFKLYFENSIRKGLKGEIYFSTIEFHYKNLAAMTGFSPKNIEIFVFKDDASKKKFLGDEVADFTKPWLNQIFVTEKSFNETIKHELAHIFLGQASNNIFKVAGKFNLGLIEGGAVALEWEWLENSPDYYAELIDRFVSKFHWNDFFKNYSFATRQSYISYLMSGAFCKYLIHKYGIEKFLSFYREGDFNSSYQKSISDEFQSFLNSLRRIKVNQEDSLKALSLFGEKSFFEKNCPRAIARIQKQASDYLNEKKYDEAESLLLKIFERRKDINAFSNLIRVKFLQKNYDEVIRLYENSEFQNVFSGISSIRLKIIYSLCLVKRGKINEAKNIFNQLKNLNLSSSWNDYFDLMLVISDYPELVELISSNPSNWIQEIIKRELSNKWIVWKNSLGTITQNELSIIVQNSNKDFWTLRKCFFRYLELGNFVRAQKIIESIEANNLITNEVEKYQIDLMSYLVEHLKKSNLESK